MSKIGIYSGCFDPIHLGHVTFALQAVEEGNLDKVYFLPERSPRDKSPDELFGHRVAMVKQALKPHRKLELLELVDKTFSVPKTLPKLQRRLTGHQLVFLFGSDKLADMANWPSIERLLAEAEVIIGLRSDYSANDLLKDTLWWPKPPSRIIYSYQPQLLSTDIRASLRSGEHPVGLLKSVAHYIRRNWLYISLS